MQVQEILIVKHKNESYGISTEDINQIARVPMLMPMPLRPAGVRGLCAVSGNIVSLLDLGMLLGMGEVDYDAQDARLLSLNNEYASNALLVSEVYNTVDVDEANIEYIEDDEDPVDAIFKYQDSLVQILSLEKLVNKIQKVSIEAKEVKNGKVKVEDTQEEATNRFLIFSMYREKYALNIDYLQEIILADQNFTELVGASKDVVGLITLRDELILVVDLRKYYGFEAVNNEDNRILITVHNGKRVGLLIDKILDIKNYALSDIEYMSENEDMKIAGVIHDEHSLISFFDEVVLEDIFQANDAFIDEVSEDVSDTSATADMREVIIFELYEKEYAFDIDSVDEIIDVMSPTKVAFSDERIDGIINIRGQVVTMVSLFDKLGLEPRTTEDAKIIICNVNNVRMGFMVDNVSDIVAIKEDEIREAEDEFFKDILYLDNGKRLVLAMDVESLIEEKEA